MSIYSGFATRNQQQTYDQLVFNLVQVLSRKILKTYSHEQTDQLKFTHIIKEIFMKLSLMEKQKYLQPNISTALYDIMEHYLEQEKHDNIEIQSKTPKFWVKIQKNSQQNQTDDTHNMPKAILQKPRKASSKVQFQIKTPVMNPEGSETQRRRQKHDQYTITLRNKFNKQKNSISKEKQRTKKHQSLRRFQHQQLNQTMYKKEQPSKHIICPHCHQQASSRKQKKTALLRNQRSQSLKRRQQKHSRIIIPELVKEYIEGTNHNYMQHFRKRKVKNGPQFY